MPSSEFTGSRCSALVSDGRPLLGGWSAWYRDHVFFADAPAEETACVVVASYSCCWSILAERLVGGALVFLCDGAAGVAAIVAAMNVFATL